MPKPNRRPKGINWDQQPLGKQPDSQIAARLGCTPSAVANARRKRGIASFRAQQEGRK